MLTVASFRYLPLTARCFSLPNLEATFCETLPRTEVDRTEDLACGQGRGGAACIPNFFPCWLHSQKGLVKTILITVRYLILYSYNFEELEPSGAEFFFAGPKFVGGLSLLYFNLKTDARVMVLDPFLNL